MPSPSTRSPSEALARALLALTLVFGAVAVSALAGAPAQAGESEDVRKAREHYKNGDDAFKAGRYDEAYREWEAGFKLSGRPLFLLNMAHAERKRGELRDARALYQRYMLMEPQTKFRAEVESVLKEIDAALAAEDAAKAAHPDPAASAPPPPPPAPATAPPAVSAPPLSLAPPPPSESRPVGGIDAEARAERGDDHPFYGRWWFWAGAGALVAAGVLTAVLARPKDSYTKSGSLGTIGTAP
jgi:hypothetical protein